MKRFLFALTFILLSLPALAQALNPPQWATGYINVAAGSTVTTNISNSFTSPTNLNITAGGAITTWNVRMPSPAFDGQLITIACPYGNVATLSVTAVAPDTVQSGGPSSCTSVPGQAVQYQYFQLLAQWTVLSTGTSPGGSGTMGMVNLTAGTNITLSGSCNSPTTINCTINTPASMGSVAIVAGTNITLTGTCTGTASINCTVNAAGAAFTAASTGGLTLTGTAFSLGGDSGNIVYTSPGQLQLGKSGTVGTLAIGNATSGLLTLKAAAGALGANSITFPITGGIIAADAFLGVGTGLSSATNLLNLGGDGHLTYQLGAATWVAADNTLGSGGLRYGWSFTYNTNYSTTSTNGFDDDVGMNLAVNDNVGQNTYSTHFRAKAFFPALLINQTNVAAGQRVAWSASIFCYGMGDCGDQNELVQYGGAPIAADEGQNFSASQYLRQQNALTKATISGVPTQTTCNTTTTTSINGSSTAQTIGVADSTNCLITNWIVVNVIKPDNSAYTEAVKITGVGAGPCPGVNCTITGVFQNDWTLGAIVNPFTSIVQGTCPGGGSTCDGTYTAKPLTGGSGTGGTATVTVSAGVASISIVTQGDNYLIGDVVSVAPANMGGITGFSATVGTICCGPWTVTPATVLTVSTTNQWGEQRVVVNKTQPSYSTGLASGGVIGTTGAFTGIGTVWASPNGPLTGGTVPNPGCITLTADNYSGPTVNNGTFTVPLQSWYEIASVTNDTSLAIYKTSVANDGSYAGNGQYASFTGVISGTTLTSSAVSGVISPRTVLQGAGITAGTTIVSGSGSAWVVSVAQTVPSEAMIASNNTDIGLGTGAYTISPCARILKVVAGGVIILDTNSFTWTNGDSVEQIIAPYPDTHGIQYIQEAYTWGGTFRNLISLDNQGGRTLQTGIALASHMQVGGGADSFAYGVGVQVNNATVGYSTDNRTTVAFISGNTTAPICWANTGGVCLSPNATLGSSNPLLINFVGGGTAGLSAAGISGSLWGYQAQASNANNPIANALPTIEFGGNLLVSAIGHANTLTTVALANVIGFDSRTIGSFQSFQFGNSDGITESTTAAKMLIYSTHGIHMYGETGGTDPTGSNASLGTVSVFQGGSEAELGLSNAALTQNVTLTVSGAGVLTVLGNGSGSSNGGIIVGAETINSFAGTGSRPVCVTSTGVLEVGSLSAGLVTCP